MGETPLPLVIEAEPIAPEPRAWLADRAQVVTCPQSDADRFEQLLARAQGLIVRTYTHVDAALLSAAPNLRVVARAGVGLDNIELGACAQRGVAVVHTPDANTDAVVEFVLACMLDAVRPREFLDGPLSRKRWDALRSELIAPRQLAGSTLGVLGLGRIGGRVARLGAALGMRVLYHDIRDVSCEEAGGATPVSQHELLERADVLTVHVDGRPGNRHLLAGEELSMLRPEVVLINTSRGFVVEPFALAEAMLERPAGCAILDVHEPEPFGPTYPLLELPNVLLTPHIAAATAEAKRNMGWVVRDLWRVLDDASMPARTD